MDDPNKATAAAEVRARVEHTMRQAGPTTIGIAVWPDGSLHNITAGVVPALNAADLLPSDVEAPFTTGSLTVRHYFPVFVSFPEGAAPLPAPVVPLPPAALPDTEQRAPDPARPADIVVDILRSQPLSKPDRQRIGRELDSANERADGTKAGTNEAFGRIRSGNPIARISLATL
jgi:hypothetical protein